MRIKEEILSWIKSGADLQDGITLFEKYGNNPHFLRLCKLSPDSNREMLNYQLISMVGISEKELKKLIKTKGDANKPGEKNRAGKHSTPQKNKDSEVPSGRSENIKETKKTKFREEWPFLNEHDCPIELKVLAADKITAWRNYTEAHKTLIDFKGLKDACDRARYIVENYKENRAIIKELNYYKEHGTVLGEHKIFAHLQQLKRLKNLNIRELIQKEDKLVHNIWRIKSEIEKENKADLLANREKRLKEKENELAEIRRLLNG